MAKAPKNLPTWRIIEFAKKGRYLGTVRAAEAKSAVKVAIKEFGIDDPHRQRRLVAHVPVGGPRISTASKKLYACTYESFSLSLPSHRAEGARLRRR
jgi:hypothetical protein